MSELRQVERRASVRGETPAPRAQRPARPAKAASENGADGSVLTHEIVTLAAVVVLGTIMTVLDATVVNVALPTLARDFHASIATIQWVPTVYLLAFAAVIPLSGWAGDRFGAKRVWVTSLAAFAAGSLLAGLSWSIWVLIAVRVLQGAGGGMIMPLGQSILAQAAGPQRIGRVMSILGVPLLLAPISGPVIGGAIVGGASWRWIFFVNLPVAAAAILLALRLLPDVPGRGLARLDLRGLVLLSGGTAAFLYGLAAMGQKANASAFVPLLAVGFGVLLVVAFVAHALRAEQPIVDVRLFRQRGFAAAASLNLVLGSGLFGVALLLPLYFQIVRGRSPLETGLLLIPQGVGAAVAIAVAGPLTDKLGARRVVPAGVALALAGTAAYTQIATSSPYWYLAGALFLVGAGLGATISPSTAAAFAGLDRAEIPRASSAINVVQRVAGSAGTALMAVVLQWALADRVRGFGGGVAEVAALVRRDPAHAGQAVATSFGVAFWVAFALAVAALVPALLLPARAER